MSGYDTTRREWLRAFVAGTAGCIAWPAGCGTASRLPPEGQIVGADHAAGHLVRDEPAPPFPTEGVEDVDVAIVGGGIAGLSAAWQLDRHGVRDWLVLELEATPGGTARGGSRDGFQFPWGAHYLPAPTRENPSLVELLREMGVVEGRDDRGEPVIGEEFLCREPSERLFYRGKWQEDLEPWNDASDDERRQWQAFEREIGRWVAWRDGQGRRAFALPIAQASDEPEVRALDRQSMSEWLAERRLTSPRLRWIVDYACRDDYGATVDHTSAWAGLFYFASRVSAPGQPAQPLITWPQGNGRVVEHLAGRAGARLRSNCVVRAVHPSSDGASRPVELVATGPTGTPVMGIRARRVIMAVPQFVAARLTREFPPERYAAAAEFHYGAWLVANLILRDRPFEPGFPLAWDNVLYDSPSLGYVTATHQRGIDHGPTVFTYYLALCDASPAEARRRLYALEWAQAAELVLADLETAHPDIRSLVQRLDVMRWGHAMVRPRPGFVWSESCRAAAAPFRGVHFAHTELSGVALLEEAFFHGLRAADEVRAALPRS